LANQGKGGALTIGAGAAFSGKWLIPRIARFTSAHPDVLINLATRDRPFDLEAESFDAAFHYGGNDWPGVVSVPLVGHENVVVCSPKYLQASPRLRTARDLSNHTLLQHTRRPTRWRQWFQAQGISDVDSWTGPRFEHFYMLTQAAIAHLGVALLPRFLVQDDIDARRLVVALKYEWVSDDGYCLVYSAGKKNDPRLEVFRRWLLEEVRG
ncbi:MAG TPA: LysR substrate-binding domain-containing protein, partial [Longimicrobiaceae bacterium]